MKFISNQKWLQDTFLKYTEERELKCKIKTEPIDTEECFQETLQSNVEFVGATPYETAEILDTTTHDSNELQGFIVKSEYEITPCEYTIKLCPDSIENQKLTGSSFPECHSYCEKSFSKIQSSSDLSRGLKLFIFIITNGLANF